MALRHRYPGIMVVAAATALAVVVARATEPETTRVSVTTGGVESTGGAAWVSAISADGAFVAFSSYATNLVPPGDTLAWRDIFLRELGPGVTTRVSVGLNGAEPDADSLNVSLSGDGRFIAFDSEATNLVPADTNAAADVFVHDRATGQTVRVSVASGGAQSTGGSHDPSISADGRFVAFQGDADDLVAGDSNTKADIFVHDRLTSVTTRVSVGSTGTQANGDSFTPRISADGRVVAFHSGADNLVPADSNGFQDVFVHHRVSGETRRVSLGPEGVQGNGHSGYASISADGGAVAYESEASNLVAGDSNGKKDIFLTKGSTTVRVNVGPGGVQADDHSFNPSMSADGQSIAFESVATNLVAGDGNGVSDIFVRRGGKTLRTGLGPGGVEGDSQSYYPALSADGRLVAFPSDATNLVGTDNNGVTDIFVSVFGPGSQGLTFL